MRPDTAPEDSRGDVLSPPYTIATAARLLETEFAAKWESRARVGPLPCRTLRAIHNLMLAAGAPVPVAAVAAAMPGEEPSAVGRAVAALDEHDLIAVTNELVVLAYPLAARPAGFEVCLPDGRVRQAPCAIDALGIPALIGMPVLVRSTCFHCREPIAIEARPDGPIRAPGISDIMVWVGQRGHLREKAWSGL